MNPTPDCSSLTTIFDPLMAAMLRRYIYEHTPEFMPNLIYRKANVAVINADDKCPLKCTNCMYAAPVAQKIYGGNPPFVSLMEIRRFVELANQADIKLLVFSGGGESIENIEAIEYTLSHCATIEEVVIITSAYFAKSPASVEDIFERIIKAIKVGRRCREEKTLSLIFRISYDQFHQVPVEYIANLLRHIIKVTDSAVQVKGIVRTIYRTSGNHDLELAERLGANLLPHKNVGVPSVEPPVIDGFPTRWLVMDGHEIPIIYKPTYFEGLAKVRKIDDISSTSAASWQGVKQAEELAGTHLNLTIRGPRGEGHNYYETILRGYTYWENSLRKVAEYVTPKWQRDKQLCIYVPADGRLIINASAPDAYYRILEVRNWEQFLSDNYRDILQNTVINDSIDTLVAIAEEVCPNLQELFDAHNFVFSIPRLTLAPPSLRLYLTIRLLQRYAYTRGIKFKDGVVHELITQTIESLQGAFQDAAKTHASPSSKKQQSYVSDPIIGNEQSIFSKGIDSVMSFSTYPSLDTFIEAAREAVAT